MTKSILVLMSGGVDSSIVAKYYQKANWDVAGLFVDYGQPWLREKRAATVVADHLKVELYTLNGVKLPVLKGNFVPMRNTYLLTLAVARAVELGCSRVGIGSNLGEFLDQRSEFVERFNFLLDYCFHSPKEPTYVLAPFSSWSKERVFKYGLQLGFPFELTRSCMDYPSCGICTSCKLRKKYGVGEYD